MSGVCVWTGELDMGKGRDDGILEDLRGQSQGHWVESYKKMDVRESDHFKEELWGLTPIFATDYHVPTPMHGANYPP